MAALASRNVLSRRVLSRAFPSTASIVAPLRHEAFYNQGPEKASSQGGAIGGLPEKKGKNMLSTETSSGRHEADWTDHARAPPADGDKLRIALPSDPRLRKFTSPNLDWLAPYTHMFTDWTFFGLWFTWGWFMWCVPDAAGH